MATPLRKADTRKKFLDDMRGEMPTHSPLGQYLRWMRSEDPDSAAALEEDLHEAFTTEAGLRVLKMFEKSALFVGAPNGSPDSALREVNAVRNFVLEIRRYVANG